MSLFKRKKAGEEANTIPEAMDDITQTLLIPVKDEGAKTMCADAYETSQAEIASYTSIGTRKSQQDSICFDFGDFCTVCAVCDGMGGLTGGERASALAAHGVTRYLLEHAQAEDIPTEMGRAALRLNEEVKNLRDPANQKIEAGTTLTTVFLRNGKLFWCSIGDSHIYLYMKKSTANHMHRKRRKNNLTWLFALLGILVLFLGTILAFLIFSNLSSEPAETVQEVSAVNVEKDIPETDMGDLIYHEPAAENVVMQGGFGYRRCG